MADGDIIVADDEKDLVLLVETALEQEGYRVRSAHDGEEAYRLALEAQPELMVVDGLMPKLSGFDLSKKIKEEAYPEGGTRILLMTAIYKKRSQKYEAQEIYKVDRLIYKPFEVEDLLATVRELLAEESSPEAESSPAASSSDTPPARPDEAPAEKKPFWKKLFGD